MTDQPDPVRLSALALALNDDCEALAADLYAAEQRCAELERELAAARAVVDHARCGFGSNEDMERAHAFDPLTLQRAIAAYDAALKEPAL